MSASIENTENCEISLIPVLDLCAVSPLAQELMEHRGKDLVIDASKVERIGAQCVQVLVSAVNTWNADGHKLTIENAPSVFSETISELGVHDLEKMVDEEEACQ